IVEGERGQMLAEKNRLQDSLKAKDDEIRSTQERVNALKKTVNSPERTDVKFLLAQLQNKANSLMAIIQGLDKELLTINTKLDTIEEKKKNGEGPSDYMVQSIMQRNEQ